MPAYFDTGFMVRQPAWHGLGTVLDDYPGRDEAMKLAGHDFTILERPVIVGGGEAEGFKALVKSTHDTDDASNGKVMHIVRDTYGVVQNDTGWDIVDAIVGAGAKYETGITMKDGAVCSVLAYLPEPTRVPGDDSDVLPYVNVSWSHDGTCSISARATSIRVVCWNTQSAAEAQGKKYGTDFTFRHSKNVMSRIDDAKMALQGVRDSHAIYMELARELAEMPVTREQRELFVTQFIPMPPESLISDRVRDNVEEARGELRKLFGESNPSIPEAHKLTAYGLHLAGGEYLDHIRGYRNQETYFGRAVLRPEPAKAKLTKLIRQCVAA